MFEAILSSGAHNYVALFVAMLFIGPIASLAAAFSATFGLFNIWAVLILTILGNVFSNFAYFSIGRFSREALIEKYGKYVWLTKKRIKHIEKNLHEHAVKTIVALKLLPFTVPLLIIPGMMRMSFKRFAIISLPITIIESIALIILGYYSGLAFSSIVAYVKNAQLIFLISVLLFILVVLFFKYYKKFVNKKLGELAK